MADHPIAQESATSFTEMVEIMGLGSVGYG